MISFIVDRHLAHGPKSVRQLVDSVTSRLWILYLPPYLLWNHLKNPLYLTRQILESRNQLKEVAMHHMRRLQKSAELIHSFFCAETTRYAQTGSH